MGQPLTSFVGVDMQTSCLSSTTGITIIHAVVGDTSNMSLQTLNKACSLKDTHTEPSGHHNMLSIKVAYISSLSATTCACNCPNDSYAFTAAAKCHFYLIMCPPWHPSSFIEKIGDSHNALALQSIYITCYLIWKNIYRFRESNNGFSGTSNEFQEHVFRLMQSFSCVTTYNYFPPLTCIVHSSTFCKVK